VELDVVKDSPEPP